jgi:uncharacterized membrane protein
LLRAVRSITDPEDEHPFGRFEETLMELAILSMDGWLMALRWFHLFFGVTWIGLLYYFNFVQGPFFAETDAPTKSQATQKLVPRALWWFRWNAMGTMIVGLLILMSRGHRDSWAVFATSWGVIILTGSVLGLLMWFNVWFVIWPNQKIVIQSATQAATGGQALPNAAAAGARALVASRTNVLFSFPMLFFMGAASHLPLAMDAEPNFALWTAVFGVIALALEANALKGKVGPMATVKGVIHCGIALCVVLYVLMEVIF